MPRTELEPGAAALAATERWFTRQGVPHFIVGAPVSTLIPESFWPLRKVVYPVRLALSVAVWTLGRVGREFRQIGRLAGRGLPLLTLFGVLTFFSGDFWHIAAALSAPWLWAVAGFFLVLTIVFLVVRLPEEFAKLTTECTPEYVRTSCAGTPIHALVAGCPDLVRDPQVGRSQRRNMLVYLLLCQQIQVALLSWMVFFFFVIFGAVAIRPTVITNWFGAKPAYPAHVLRIPIPGVSSQLLHVSLLLASLSAFYFAISAVTDAGYREEFFDRTLSELGRALGVRCGYLTVRQERGDRGAGAGTAVTPSVAN